MSTVLQSIIEGVLEDVKAREIPMREIQARAEEAEPLRGAHRALTEPGLQVIAEVKRSSPSKGALAAIADPAKLASEYEEGGAAVVSVLTERRRFNGSDKDFADVRSAVSIPMLRKDFIVTEYQIFESRAMGADLLLLIVAGLEPSQLRDYFQIASGLGMDILVETHDESELESAIDIGAKIIGVNSRNLKTLDVDVRAFDRLIPLVPKEIVAVAESGIREPSEVAHLRELGAGAILVGETLVISSNPKTAIAQLLGNAGTF